MPSKTLHFEIAFTALRNHPDVRNLKVLDRGIYVALVQACILDGVNPLPYDRPRTMAHLAGATSQQWLKGKAGALRALDGTLGELQELYQQRAATRAKRAAQTRRVLGGLWEKTRLAKRARDGALKQAQEFVEKSTGCGTLLPQPKLKSYRPISNNEQVRREAISNKQQSKGERLRD